MSPSGPAEAAVPLVYRLILQTIEPALAAAGAVLVLADPATYAGGATRGALAFAPATAFLYTGLGGAWLYFAFVEAVVLRRATAAGDVALWRALCAGMLLSDAAFLHGMAQAVGGWRAYADLAAWTAHDWLALATTAPMVLARVCVVLAVGLRPAAAAAGAKATAGKLG